MHTAALVAVFAAAAVFAGKVTVVNNCGADENNPMFVWTASNDKAAEGQDILGGTFEVEIEEDGVHEIKLTRGDVTEDGETTGADLTVPGPQLTLVYGIRDDRIAYDL